MKQMLEDLEYAALILEQQDPGGTLPSTLRQAAALLAELARRLADIRGTIDSYMENGEPLEFCKACSLVEWIRDEAEPR